MGRWEEATVSAAARPEVDFNAFVRAVLNVHPSLAARCVLEAARTASDDLRQAVIDRLLAIVERRDPLLSDSHAILEPAAARLSLRIAAGHALGKLGDPRILAGRGRASLRGASFGDEAISSAADEIASRPTGARDDKTYKT